MIAESEILTARVPFAGADTPSDAIINTCVHCGLCLSSCPTYRETGLEMFSPRGRIYLMKGVADGRIGMESDVFQEQMSACLNCRACEAVCPSGVQYGQILEASRTQIEDARDDGRLPPHPWPVQLLRSGVFGVLFKRLELFRGFSRLMWLYQRSGVQALARQSGLLKLLGLADTEALLPPMSDAFTVPQGQIYPAEGTARYHVALLTGCVMATAFADVHAATLRVLRKNGCEVILPPDQGCCGALHVHGGDMDGGRELARRNIAAFEGLGLDAIIVNAAGCGSTMKEYGHLLHDDPAWAARAAAFSAKVKDISEFLAAIELNTCDLKPLPITVTYQEPCHLAHAQRISAQPRKLLRAIPRLVLKEMPESSLCCGSAGIYNVTQPEMAAQLGARKLNNAQTTNAEVLVTANPGCHLQLAGGLRRRGSTMRVRHIVELLDAAYAGDARQL
ncbi:MAG TPA: heterodisulfide reductase-related iron-sulfur binding cluster [Kouleothrix sp.]|nr:heterodisulfide reductase-related iron-sulfur binding cluster [Kouleothrix sp.]